jgi:hypothetical protein
MDQTRREVSFGNIDRVVDDARGPTAVVLWFARWA